MNTQTHTVFLLSLACLLSCATAREWTDAKGRSMEADFVKKAESSKGTEVVFKLSSGMHTRVPLSDLSEADQQYIAKLQPQQTSAKKVEAPAPKTEFELTITKDLVESKGTRTKRIGQDELAPKDYYAIYYSAHWCPPCRGFTPKLVDFYEKASRKHDNFEVIFVSSDRSEDAMADYMHEADMPWPALNYDQKKKSKALTKYAGGGIPCLVLVDKDGNVLSDSYVNGKYVGPTKVMNDLEERLENGS